MASASRGNTTATCSCAGRARSSALFDANAAARDVTALRVAGTTRALGLDLPPEAEELRVTTRAVAEEIAALPADDQRTRLIETGYIQPHWPQPWGREAKALEQLVIDEEFARAGVQRPQFGITGWVILTLIQHSTQDQIERWVRPTLNGELVWCQLFSEPDAGSDAAGVRTTATRVGRWLHRLRSEGVDERCAELSPRARDRAHQLRRRQARRHHHGRHRHARRTV